MKAHVLVQCCLIEFSVMVEILYIYTVQWGSHMCLLSSGN